jgi:hypothetical protein
MSLTRASEVWLLNNLVVRLHTSEIAYYLDGPDQPLPFVEGNVNIDLGSFPKMYTSYALMNRLLFMYGP